ncbi:MAG: phosphatase PAP2-related protein [Bacteroidota bacterium]|nr:phosphatase PAP2-related protein [Bacteroidota bacterium]MDP4247107.1 phosphatase PAP2-related protein [Bacteroidota bacterium]MDP4253242.1 phosphatase PAP2-related protein [Bacteroidota bacterium]MDP4257412.1 phosphatase PAP2-related protein [Bacteroidota bacterium]
MPQSTYITLRQEWATAWQSPRFRWMMRLGASLTIIMLSLFPLFFQIIEKRDGIVVNDRLLDILPPHNVSMGILLIVWSMGALMLVRCIRSPELLMTFIWSYVAVNLCRVLTITLVPLDPPANLIVLADPMSNAFYGAKFVTKDLFFSGHTSAVFLIFLCLPGRTDKAIALTASVLVGILVLVQHIHYTMDVVAAPLFTWLLFVLMQRVLQRYGVIGAGRVVGAEADR